jgi:NitT/TauT family transport system ATP-binding protein
MPAAASDATISLERVTKSYGAGPDRVPVLVDVDLVIARGRFVSVIGPSGCGKSTMLRILAGLVVPEAGQASLFGETPADACAAKHVGWVPQAPALLAWRSVLDNVALPTQVNRRARGGSARPVPDLRGLLAQVELSDVADRRPAELSGGQAQRVAIARAFATGAPVLLMDEPFSALDELTREVLRQALLDLWEAHRATVIFVTHSVTEAVYLSDEVVVLSARPGRIVARVPVPLGRPRREGVELAEDFRSIEAEVRRALRAGGDPDGPSPGPINDGRADAPPTLDRSARPDGGREDPHAGSSRTDGPPR